MSMESTLRPAGGVADAQLVVAAVAADEGDLAALDRQRPRVAHLVVCMGFASNSMTLRIDGKRPS